MLREVQVCAKALGTSRAALKRLRGRIRRLPL